MHVLKQIMLKATSYHVTVLNRFPLSVQGHKPIEPDRFLPIPLISPGMQLIEVCMFDRKAFI